MKKNALAGGLYGLRLVQKNFSGSESVLVVELILIARDVRIGIQPGEDFLTQAARTEPMDDKQRRNSQRDGPVKPCIEGPELQLQRFSPR
jgi:hypothetical protein